MIYGYIRVSTKEQNLTRQIKAMEQEGIVTENLFIDKASGKNFDRPAYQALMEKVQPGDKIVVDSLDRLGRDYDGLIAQWKRLTHEQGVDIQALDMPFMDSAYFRKLGDLGKLVEDMFLGILAWVADHERQEIMRRQREGIEKAKVEGKYQGRQNTVYDPEILAQAQGVLNQHGKSAAARVLGVSRSTIQRMCKDGRLVA